jgi:hypothetical protein
MVHVLYWNWGDLMVRIIVFMGLIHLLAGVTDLMTTT